MNRRDFLKKGLEGIVIGSIPLIYSCSKNPVDSKHFTLAKNNIRQQRGDLEDRTRIAFSSNKDGNYNIYTTDLYGFDLKQLTYEGFNRYPAWSPDGKKIAYSNNNKIWIMNSDGTNQDYLTDGWTSACWSPDGKKIAFIRDIIYTEFNSGIYIINSDGSNQEQLFNGFFCANPSWSPDGTKILFDQGIPSIPEDPWHRSKILMMDIQNKNQSSLDYGSFPSWSPDGKKIIYVKYAGIWEMDANGGNKKNLLNIHSYSLEHPTWSLDGKKIAYSYNNGIYIMKSDGTNQDYFTDGSSPAWSPYLKLK